MAATEPSGTAGAGRSGGRPATSAPFWLLALVTLGGSLSMHIFVPAQPVVAASLRTGHALAQATLTAYVVGLAVGQLLYGPSSDRLGRRPVLIFGLALYTAGSLAALAAPSIATLIAARFVQAVGAGAGVVLGRAIVRDRFAGSRAAEMLALLNLAVLLAPGISPLLGSVLVALGGWRSILIVLAAFGAFNLLSTIVLLPETAHGTKRGLGAVLSDHAALLGSRRFVGYSLAGGCASTSVYAFIGAAPFIFVRQLHRPAREIGFYLALNIAGIAIGSLSVRSLVRRIEGATIMRWGNALGVLGAAALVGIALAGHPGLGTVLGAMLLFTIGSGAVAPLAMAEALNVNPDAAGSSSGLYGCTQMVTGALCTTMGSIGPSPLLAAGLTMLAGTATIQICLHIAGASSDAAGGAAAAAARPPG